MHISVFEFIKNMALTHPEHFENKRVLEVGSRDLNGSVRPLFFGCDYTGLDLTEGPGVDKVSHVCELNERPESFETVISTEALEHDQFWFDSLCKMFELTCPGGAMLITCASTGREEHGTHKADPSCSPATLDWYMNVTPKDFLKAIDLHAFEIFYFEFTPGDLRFFGIKNPLPITVF